MAATKFNAEAARAELGDQLAAAEALAERLDAEIGALALAVVLDEAPESDLAGAREARANAAAKVAELRAALVALGIRENAQAKADEARQRKADAAELERLNAKAKAASAKAAELVGTLAAVVGEAMEAEAGAVTIARRLDVTQRAAGAADLAVLVLATLPLLAPFLRAGYASPAAGEAAAARLKAVS